VCCCTCDRHAVESSSERVHLPFHTTIGKTPLCLHQNRKQRPEVDRCLVELGSSGSLSSVLPLGTLQSTRLSHQQRQCHPRFRFVSSPTCFTTTARNLIIPAVTSPGVLSIISPFLDALAQSHPETHNVVGKGSLGATDPGPSTLTSKKRSHFGPVPTEHQSRALLGGDAVVPAHHKTGCDSEPP